MAAYQLASPRGLSNEPPMTAGVFGGAGATGVSTSGGGGAATLVPSLGLGRGKTQSSSAIKSGAADGKGVGESEKQGGDLKGKQTTDSATIDQPKSAREEK